MTLRSIETLLSLPTVTPDRSGYQRPDCGSVDAVMVWMVYERSNGWWRTPNHQVRDAAVYWLALRCRAIRMAPSSRRQLSLVRLIRHACISQDCHHPATLSRWWLRYLT
jgi:hypothetical protein